jgi:TfoX/Sxy family transcriptional regulator of competence genes
MAYDEHLAARVRALLTRRSARFAEKSMMGGLCFTVDGKMCVGVEKERLMVRLDPEIHERALGFKGAAPMDFTGRPMRGFVFVSASTLETEAGLSTWMDLALEFNPRAKPSKTKAKSKTANRSSSKK